VSKHGRRKKNRPKPPPGVCRRCSAPKDTSPGALLKALAAILNICAAEGVKVRFGYGAVLAREGYVIKVGGRWVPRLLTGDPLSPDESDGLDD
jgi:hypothetical protein